MKLATRLGAVIVTLMLYGQGAAGQQNDENARATLRGIRQIALVVNFQGEAALQQFQQAPILKDIQQRVVMVGIDINSLQVFSGGPVGDKPRAPIDYVYIYVDALKSPVYPVAACSISIEASRRVRLDGNDDARAVTWKISRVFMFPSSILRDSLRKAIGDELEEFVTAYVAANRK